MTAKAQNPARGIAITAGGAFAAFYIFYTAATVAFAHTSPGARIRVAVVMLVVVAVQLLILMAGRRTHIRRRTALTATAVMGLGSASLPFVGHWPGQILLAVAFGAFVVTGTAWIKEAVPPGELGRALGVYGFSSAIGGAFDYGPP